MNCIHKVVYEWSLNEPKWALRRGHDFFKVCKVYFTLAREPSPAILCPKNITSDIMHTYFFLFNFKPCFLIDLKTSIALFCNSSRVSTRVWLFAAPSMFFLTFGIFYFGKHHLLNECHVWYTKNDNNNWGSWKSIALIFQHWLGFANNNITGT